MSVRSTAAFLATILTLCSVARAEDWPYAEWEHRFEVTPYIAHQWTGARSSDFREISGTFDFENGVAWGAIVDVNLAPGVQAEAMYQRQDTRLSFRQTRSDAEEDLFDVGIDYLQAGVLGGTQYGKVFVFTKVTLGANHFDPEGAGAGDVWRFAATLGFGAKLYAHRRVGLRLELQLPWTYLSGDSRFFCDEDGCLSPVGGTGLVQMNVALGAMFLWGG